MSFHRLGVALFQGLEKEEERGEKPFSPSFASLANDTEVKLVIMKGFNWNSHFSRSNYFSNDRVVLIHEYGEWRWRVSSTRGRPGAATPGADSA